MSDLKPWEIVTAVLKMLVPEAKAGVTTKYLDQLAEAMVLEMGGTPFNKGYHPDWAPYPYPATLCTCLNDEVCHSFPSERVLKDGDLLSIDIGVKKDGLCGDSALTLPIGRPSPRDGRLLYYSQKTLEEGIKKVRSGAKVSDLGRTMGNFAALRGFVINRSFCGHGISKEMHETPQIPNFYSPEMEVNDSILFEGQMICLEPMLTYKDMYGVSGGNGWLVKTRDGRKSCLFEAQLLVTSDGCEVLTKHI